MMLAGSMRSVHVEVESEFLPAQMRLYGSCREASKDPFAVTDSQ